jgi:hypothetical protein
MADSLKFSKPVLSQMRRLAKKFGDQAVTEALAAELAQARSKPTQIPARQLLLAGLYRSRSWPRRLSVGVSVKITNETFRIAYGPTGGLEREAAAGPATHMDLKRGLEAAEKDEAIKRRISEVAAALADMLSENLRDWQNTPMVANRPPKNPPSMRLTLLPTTASLQIRDYERFCTWVAAIPHPDSEDQTA